MIAATPDTNTISSIKTAQGSSLGELSFKSPVLLVFLRHFGCVFCREALHDLADLQGDLEKKGAKLVMVHLADDQTAEKYFDQYGLKNVEYISDPDAIHYESFGLLKGRFSQLFGLKVWLRSIDSGIRQGHGLRRKTIGDGFQMPGIFGLKNGEVRSSFIHKHISDRPDYIQLIEDCCSS